MFVSVMCVFALAQNEQPLHRSVAGGVDKSDAFFDLVALGADLEAKVGIILP